MWRSKKPKRECSFNSLRGYLMFFVDIRIKLQSFRRIHCCLKFFFENCYSLKFSSVSSITLSFQKNFPQGKLIYSDGSKFEGEFKDGEKHGQGKYISPNGSKYEGEYKDSKYHGQGKFTSPDGSSYEGQWKDGKYHGQGTYTFSDGGKGIGDFREDNPWNITEYDKNGNIIGKIVNGEQQ